MVAISEMAGMEGEVVSMQDIFKFEIQHTDQSGKISGEFLPTGLRSTAASFRRGRRWRSSH